MLGSPGEFCDGGYFVADRCNDSVEVARRPNGMGIECATRVYKGQGCGHSDEVCARAAFDIQPVCLRRRYEELELRKMRAQDMI